MWAVSTYYDMLVFNNHVWLIFPLAPLSITFFISSLAETKQNSFDLAEAEAESVAGYNLE